jgi:outer membrane protein assembly factor BamE (lipoprotein component of BamABCDE complex)
MKKTLLIAITSCSLLAGCMTASQHQAEVDSSEEARLTLAAVQSKVQVGMSGAQVLQTLGSPNIISTDEKRHEVWVYDRVGSEYTYSDSDLGLISLIAGASGAVAGGVLPSYKSKAGANRRSQKTLTIIIHFDADKRVEDFSYHASQF